MWLGEVVLLRIRGSRKASKYSSAARIENANWMLDSALTRCAASPKAHRVRIANLIMFVPHVRCCAAYILRYMCTLP
jgi:hypothetical protein